MKPTCSLIAASLCTLGFCQPEEPETTPPPEIATEFVSFVGWALAAPPTKAQASRIALYLEDGWRQRLSGRKEKVFGALALKKELERMGLANSAYAPTVIRRMAVAAWRRASSDDMSRWGLSIADASRRSIAKGPPSLSRQAADAYIELASHIVREITGTPAADEDGEARIIIMDLLASEYAKLSVAQREQLGQVPEIWFQFRSAWARHDEASRAEMRKSWLAELRNLKLVTKEGSGSSRPSLRPQRDAAAAKLYLQAVLSLMSSLK